LVLLAFLPGLALAAAGGTALPATISFERAPSILAARCAACHDWAATPASILGSGLVKPGNATESPLAIRVSEGSMPPGGSGLPAAEVEAIRAWVEAGAPVQDALSGSSQAPAPSPFLGFPSKTAFHRAAGWTSGGLLLAAGGIGALRALSLQSAGHAYRDANGGEDAFNDGNSPLCAAEIAALWEGDQWLRWTHLGLLAAGESLYLANAATGVSFMDPAAKGLSRSMLHRWAFFIHGGLMLTQAALGFVTTDALARGDHALVSSLGVAHAAVGFAIPLAIFGSGAILSLP
jgi:hypothetical protein